MKYFFIVGCPRSGTTVLQQALNRHSRIVIAPETRFFFLIDRPTRRGQANCAKRIEVNCGIDVVIERKIRGTVAARNFYGELAGRYLDHLERAGVTHFGEKSPEHFRKLRRLLEIFPSSKIIVIYRDGRDVALSLSKVPWMHPDLYVDFAVWLYYYRLQRHLMKQQLNNVYFLKYEQFVHNPESELKKVLEFLGIQYEHATAEGHGNRDGIPEWEYAWKSFALEKISDIRVGSWAKTLRSEQVRMLEIWGREALLSLGYEVGTPAEARLPLTFFPKLYWKILAWRTTRLLHMMALEVLPNYIGSSWLIAPREIRDANDP